MRKVTLIAVLMMIIGLTASCMAYADNCKRHLPGFRPQYTFIVPYGATILTEKDIAEVLAEGCRCWDDELAALRDDLNRYELWDEAERLWLITERSVHHLVGQIFPSREEAFRKAYCLMDGLIASGVSILEELIGRQQAS